jgi:Polyketide synthase modules and related proteins
MTRVSDRAEFARAVADGGALPFLALALMRSDEAAALVEETAAALRGRSWGVGLLGFAPPEIREEQLEVVRTHRPPFALIAGGRPDQAQALEEQGVATYLHVPSPALLKMYLAQGARRFVFEGRECGGHVGPRSSFVLWNQMIDVMLEDLPAREMPSCHVLFAGGVHDARSAAIVAAMSAPLAERGAGTGVLVGTGYLFTEEAVATGAVTASFQRQMLSCAETTLLETGPGHAIRVVPTPYAEEFEQARRDMAEAGKPVNEIRDALESMNMGRLRIASKGRARTNAHGTSETRRLRKVGDEEALQAGMYMAGQVAALRSERTTIHELHLDVSERAEDLVASAARRLPAEARAASRRQPMAVAIIGIECVLPGCADLEAYWQRILEKRSAIVEVPRDRWDWRLFFDADPAARDKIYSKSGGFLEPLPFNPLDFGMPPNSVKSIEPLQLLTLIVARNALRTAGYENRPFDKSRTGVIFGLSGGLGEMAYRYIMRSEMPQLFGSVAAELTDASGDILPEWTEDSYAGLLPNVTAGRVANRLDFGGPSYTVDAACASSLAALQAAVNELERGDTDMMLVGGLDNTNNPFTFTAFSKTRALSPTGACHTFDAGADGIAISEGLMMLVLKRLPDAERDGDHIFAVIRGIGSSSDGRARGLTAPRAEGQQLAIRRAYDMAGVSPVTVGLFEAHGTGTVVGDRTEVQALAEFLENAGAAPNSAAIGSVKSVIGHTKAAAGVCGVAKAALALDRKVLPPTAGVVTPNPEAAFGTRPLYVNSEARPWINAGAAHPRRAGVSAFGFGGTNFHAVLEEYDGDGCDDTPAQREWPAELFLFSEKTPAGLYEKLSTWRKRVDEWAEEPLRNLAFTACEESRRSGLAADLRLAIVATGADDLKAKLDSAIRAAAESRPVHDPRGIYLSLAPLTEKGTIAFLFPGQGSQYTNMLAGLAMQFEVVRAALERADEYLFERLPQPLSSYVFPPPVFDENEREAQTAALTDTRVAQPALGAAGTAMLELLSTLGVEPAMTAGHSYGEYVALFAAGAMDERTLLRLSEARGRAIVECATGELGTMAAVGAAPHAVISALDGTADVWIANHNAPEQTVIAGTADGIEAARKSLMAKGVAVKGISVACAFHSPLVAPARDKLLAELSQSELHELQKPAFSNSTGEPYPCGADELRRVLADHLVQPVRFVDEIRTMYDAGARIFVEVGPRSVLTSLARSILEGRDHVAIATDEGAGAQPTDFLHALGQLATQGVPVRTEALFRGREAHMPIGRASCRESV